MSTPPSPIPIIETHYPISITGQHHQEGITTISSPMNQKDQTLEAKRCQDDQP